MSRQLEVCLSRREAVRPFAAFRSTCKLQLPFCKFAFELDGIAVGILQRTRNVLFLLHILHSGFNEEERLPHQTVHGRGPRNCPTIVLEEHPFPA